MIGKKIFGIPIYRLRARRWFVACYWLTVAAALAVFWSFPMPPDVSRWSAFLPLLLTLGIASNLPLLLGGFSVGGAVHLELLPRYEFVLLELLLLASLSLPQCCILWTTPDVEPDNLFATSQETQCEPN